VVVLLHLYAIPALLTLGYLGALYADDGQHAFWKCVWAAMLWPLYLIFLIQEKKETDYDKLPNEDGHPSLDHREKRDDDFT
jgi:hypothetical protein